MKNPKLEGTDIIDCIPQTGECPIGCAECFYNGGRFYRTLDEPLIPTAEESDGKIVRINSGHDSNVDRQCVVGVVAPYVDFFFNTSVPKFDFPGPVVFTCNGKTSHFVHCSENVMFVRVRANTWDLEIQDKLVEHYVEQNVPVVITFMRYYAEESVVNPDDYSYGKSILNEYWKIKPEAWIKVMRRYEKKGVRTCGTPSSSYCVDCRNCELLYREYWGE